jgi:hypothetical protein
LHAYLVIGSQNIWSHWLATLLRFLRSRVREVRTKIFFDNKLQAFVTQKKAPKHIILVSMEQNRAP